jgi:hypothetical protein
MKQRNFDPKLVPSYMLANKLDIQFADTPSMWLRIGFETQRAKTLCWF